MPKLHTRTVTVTEEYECNNCNKKHRFTGNRPQLCATCETKFCSMCDNYLETQQEQDQQLCEDCNKWMNN